MSKRIQQILAFVFGVVFVVTMLVLAIFFPNPTPYQYIIFKTVLALAAAGVAAMIPGFFKFTSPVVSAGGALAVFAVVYFYNPASFRPVTFPVVDSGWIPGGRDPVSYCNAQLEGLQKQYPGLKIETVKRYEFPPDKDKNFAGIVTGMHYRYQCWFKAT